MGILSWELASFTMKEKRYVTAVVEENYVTITLDFQIFH